jgi:hypothetical protein
MLPDSSSSVNLSPWFLRAPSLAEWAEVRLVNRYDASGGYHAGGQFTRHSHLTIDHLRRHFQAREARDIVGLHTAGADNLSLGGAIDIDQHGNDPVKAEANISAAVHWFAVLRFGGFHPLLTGSNGRGGFHLRLLLRERIDAARVFHFLRWLTSDYRKMGLVKPPEQFPKQPDVRKCTVGMGNWIRIFGRHYKRPYWSEVWDGLHWLEGHAAIDFLLSLEGDDPALVPDVPPPPPPRPTTTPPRRPWSAGRPGNLAAVIAAYMKKLPNLSEGEGRDDVAFNFAAWLCRDMGVEDSIALDWLERWDAGNHPPKGRQRLAEIIRNAHLYGQRAVGSGIKIPDASKVSVTPTGRPGHYTLRGTVEVE